MFFFSFSVFIFIMYCCWCMVEGTEDGGMGLVVDRQPSLHLLQIYRICVSTQRTLNGNQSRILGKAVLKNTYFQAGFQYTIYLYIQVVSLHNQKVTVKFQVFRFGDLTLIYSCFIFLSIFQYKRIIDKDITIMFKNLLLQTFVFQNSTKSLKNKFLFPTKSIICWPNIYCENKLFIFMDYFIIMATF